MSQVLKFTCELPNGVHARPASHIETLCNQFTAHIEWLNLRTGRKGNAKSALALIGTDTLHGDECHLMMEGADAEQALERLSSFIKNEFPHCDAPLPQVAQTQDEELPQSLTNLTPKIVRARSVCGGIANGILVHLSGIDFNRLGELPASRGVEVEQRELDAGLSRLLKSLELQLMDDSGTASAVLEAHRSLLSDNSLRNKLLEQVVEGASCAQAIVAAGEYFCQQFAASASEYLQERALDVRDVCFQLLQQIYGTQRFPSQISLQQNSICMADELTPSQFLELDKSLLKGLLLNSGGSTSHTVILARSFNIPTLVGVDANALADYVQQNVQIDGDLGLIALE
ncbi:MAG: HPr family phosphocarrier protein, partial [Enterobacterales bacterium]|nr:HPr family phosphocarrier protein [Enterobacterales bacterium]